MNPDPARITYEGALRWNSTRTRPVPIASSTCPRCGRRHRRPTGAPPPLPKKIGATGVLRLALARARRRPGVHLAARQPWAARSVRRRDHRRGGLASRGVARHPRPLAQRVRLALRARAPDAAHDRDRGVVQAVAAPHLVPDRRGALRSRRPGAPAPRVATTAVRRHDHRNLGGVFGPVAPDGRPRASRSSASCTCSWCPAGPGCMPSSSAPPC